MRRHIHRLVAGWATVLAVVVTTFVGEEPVSGANLFQGELQVFIASTLAATSTTDAVCEAVGSARCWYVAADASSGGDGSFGRPFRRPQDAAERAEPGDFIYLRGGTEFTHEHAREGRLISVNGRCCRNGEPDAIITIKSYPDEQAVGRGVLQPEGNLSINIARSFWRVEGLRLIHGTIGVAGGFARDVEHVWIVGNHLSDIVAARGNYGIISIVGQSDQLGSSDERDPSDVFIHDNTLHTLWGVQQDGSGPLPWHEDRDTEHHACLQLQRASGPVEIIGNEMYECASIFYFKFRGKGPVTIAANRIYRAQRLGIWRSARNTFRGNLVHDVARGLWLRSSSVENVLASNTIVGGEGFASFDAVDTQTLRDNVYFGGHWIGGRGDFSAATSDGNCFITPVEFQAYGEDRSRTAAESTRSGGQRPERQRGADDDRDRTDRTARTARSRARDGGAEPRARDRGAESRARERTGRSRGRATGYSLEEVRSRFGNELNSVRIVERNPAAAFRDPATGDYTLIGDPAASCQGRGASLP